MWLFLFHPCLRKFIKIKMMITAVSITAQKVSVFFGVFLVLIFPYSNWIWGDVSLRVHSKLGKIRNRKTPNTDTFHVEFCQISMVEIFAKRFIIDVWGCTKYEFSKILNQMIREILPNMHFENFHEIQRKTAVMVLLFILKQHSRVVPFHRV